MPASTPKAVQDKVHDAVNQVLAMPETQARLDAIGAEVTPMTQAQFAAFHAAGIQALRRHHQEEQHPAELTMQPSPLPVVALTLGDPAGIGAELKSPACSPGPRLRARQHRAGRRPLAVGGRPAHVGLPVETDAVPSFAACANAGHRAPGLPRDRQHRPMRGSTGRAEVAGGACRCVRVLDRRMDATLNPRGRRDLLRAAQQAGDEDRRHARTRTSLHHFSPTSA